MRIAFQNRLALIALASGLPATAIAVWFAWTDGPTPELRFISVVLLLGFWIGCALAVRRRLVFPLQTLANLIEAVRAGDYTLRGRRAAPGDTLGEVVREINKLGETLQRQRLESLEAIALVQTVLEELDAAVLTFDGARRLKLVNRAAADLLGRSSQALLGRTAREIGVDELLAREGPVVASLSFGGRSGRFEVRTRIFRESGVPHTLLMISDLSRALRDEERRAWQRLIRVIGHEINNSLAPITSLAGTLRDMLRKEPAARDQTDVLEGLGLIGDRAASLTKFVATYSQLARLPAPSKHPVSLNALLNRLVTLDAMAGVRVTAPFETVVSADAGQLEQALINLIKNAVEAAPSGAKGVEIEVARTREAAQIEIRDDGPGIANPDNLFVPFFTTKPGGSGIGLALSRQIVEAHGGTLTLENRADRTGTIARVMLPMPLE
ncbi:MAG TPA: ATP-binding protein [Steroidobacteraceae bacterium]|nr:ATP-binding protein [Steroidobacteraceae bacterium]